jgi:hypothetical protein
VATGMSRAEARATQNDETKSAAAAARNDDFMAETREEKNGQPTIS